MKVLVKFTQKETGVWHAYCPALPGCLAVARTEQEVAEKITRAIEGYIASLNVPTSAVETELVAV